MRQDYASDAVPIALSRIPTNPLSGLKRQGVISTWHDRWITAGTDLGWFAGTFYLFPFMKPAGQLKGFDYHVPQIPPDGDVGNEEDLKQIKASIKRLPTGPGRVDTSLIQGADHMYDGHEDRVAQVIASW